MASLPNSIIPCSTSYSTNRTAALNDCYGVKTMKGAIPGDILPQEIMMLIVSKLDLVGFHRFSAVCKSWQSIAIAFKNARHLHLRPQLPWLMLSSSEDDHHNHGFLNLSHDVVFKLELPEALIGAECCGSNWGWLIMVVGRKVGRHFLWNPLTKVVIELPPKATVPLPYRKALFRRRFIKRTAKYCHKAILLSPPAAAAAVGDVPRDGCVLVYYKRFLAFCRPGDERWTLIRSSHKFEDIICYNGKLYGITKSFDPTSFDLKSFDLILLELDPHPHGGTKCGIPAPPIEKLFNPWSFYLVECLGELLTVIKGNPESHPKTVWFKIFKLDPKGLRWIEVEDLGDQMLFIGTSTGSSLSTLDYPGFRGNCIYFADDYSHKYALADRHDLGVFHLQDNSIEPFCSNYSQSSMPLHIWFTPVPW